jgi:hypothetical protein
VLKGQDPKATCDKGYAKPAWQTGPGVPNDGVRDVPDLALFSGDGGNKSFYVLCESDLNTSTYPECDTSSAKFEFIPIGGTSVAAPIFAGIMALINQKTGERQGNANYVLYGLAAEPGATCTSDSAAVGNPSCIFYDITTGNNSVACKGGSPGCSASSGGTGMMVEGGSSSSAAWPAGPGYDLATGLGSINAANLVNHWTSVTFKSTTTQVGLTPTTIMHGQPVSVNATVTGAAGTPTGAVSLIAACCYGRAYANGVATFTLDNGAASGTTNMLPGGVYELYARYGGDGTYAASNSPQLEVRVNPEASQTKVALVTFNPKTGAPTYSVTSAAYGSPYVLRMDVTNSAGQECSANPVPCPTGQITVTNNGKSLDNGTYALNSQGYAEDQPIQLGPGSHDVAASYSGDVSFEPSTATAAITIGKAATTSALTSSASSIQYGDSVTLTAAVTTASNGAAPMGTVQFLNGSTPISGTVAYKGSAGSGSGPATLAAVLVASLPSSATISAKYSGDADYSGNTSAPTTVNVVPGFTLSMKPATISVAAAGQSGSSTLTVGFGPEFSGTVSFNCALPASMQAAACSFSPSSLTGSGNATLTLSTTAASVSWSRRSPGGPFIRPFVLLWLLLLGTAVLRHRRQAAFAVLLVTLLGMSLGSCGGGASGGGSSESPPSTAAGQYTVPVTGVSGTVSHTVNLSVTVP